MKRYLRYLPIILVAAALAAAVAISWPILLPLFGGGGLTGGGTGGGTPETGGSGAGGPGEFGGSGAGAVEGQPAADAAALGGAGKLTFVWDGDLYVLDGEAKACVKVNPSGRGRPAPPGRPTGGGWPTSASRAKQRAAPVRSGSWLVGTSGAPVSLPTGGAAGSFAWSPDGSEIAYSLTTSSDAPGPLPSDVLYTTLFRWTVKWRPQPRRRSTRSRTDPAS